MHVARQFHFHSENKFFLLFLKKEVEIMIAYEISLYNWLGIWLFEHLSLTAAEVVLLP